MKAPLPRAGSTASEKATAAEHIAVEAGKLARIANVNAFPLLAYLIDMVVLEAWREAGEAEPERATGRHADAEGV